MEAFEAYHFSGQKDGERIRLVIRRHWFNIFQSLFPLLLMALFLLGSYLFLPQFFPVFAAAQFSAVFMFIGSLVAMAIWVLFFLIWIDYYFDVWIVTNRRVVNVKQKGLFSREVSEVELDKIQDITTEVKGIIPTFLNFGNVYIQTAGEKERFTFAHVPDPYEVKDTVMNLQNQGEKQAKRAFGEAIREEIHRKDAE